MPERSEQSLRDLSRQSGHRTFRVLAEWLKENRNNMEKTLSAQSLRMEEIAADLRSTQGKILEEVKRINGRVYTIENEKKLENAVSDARHDVLAELQEGEVIKIDSKRWKISQVIAAFGAMAAMMAAFGACAGYVGNALGWW